MENVVKLPFSKPLHFKTYRPKERTLNSSYATSYKSKNLFDNILSPENQTRSLHNRLENAQKRIENIENDQKSVKRLLTSLKGGSDDLITEENLYLIEKVKVPKGTKQVIDDSFLENPPPEIEESHFRKETLREILLKMNMFKKTYSCKSNLERIFEHIRKKIEKNFGFYYDFLNENNIQHLKVFIQILYDAIDNLILSYSSVSSHQNFQKTSFEQKIRDLNEAILEKMDLLENLQNEKNLLNRTFIFHQKVIEEIALQVQSMKESSLFPLDKLKLLLKDYKTMDISKEYKSLDDYRSLEAYKEDFIESKDADQIKMKLQTEALEEEIRKYKDLLIEKNQRNEESQQLKNGLQEYKKKFEIKEQEVKNLQKTLEDTRKEISGLSKDLILNSKDKEDFLMKITDDNEALLRKKDDLSKKNEILIKENKLLERKFEEQLVIFKGDLQKAWKTVLELTEKKSILENEKEGLLKKLNEEEEVRDRVLREARLQESKGLNDKLERYERNFQELIGEKSLLQEKLIITEEKLRVLQERLFSNEREKKVMQDKIQLKKESYINEYKKELKEVLYLEGNSLKDLKLMTKIFIHTLEVLSRISYNSMPHSLMQLKEELIHKKEEIWQRFNQNYEEFSQMLSNFKNKYDINLDIEDLSISNLTINYEKNNKSISEISQKSIKNYDSGTIKKDKNHEENIEMMIYLQACSLENMLEQLQNNESQLDERNHTEEDKNNISLINSDLEKINEMNEDDETHTQLSNQSLKI